MAKDVYFPNQTKSAELADNNKVIFLFLGADKHWQTWLLNFVYDDVILIVI